MTLNRVMLNYPPSSDELITGVMGHPHGPFICKEFTPPVLRVTMDGESPPKLLSVQSLKDGHYYTIPRRYVIPIHTKESIEDLL